MLDPMPRHDLTLPPRQPEAATIAHLRTLLHRAHDAVAKETERCAKIADAQEKQARHRWDEHGEVSDWDGGTMFGTEIGARMIAAAIRAQPPQPADEGVKG